MFDPQIPACLPSVSTPVALPLALAWLEEVRGERLFQHGTVACARAQTQLCNVNMKCNAYNATLHNQELQDCERAV